MLGCKQSKRTITKIQNKINPRALLLAMISKSALLKKYENERVGCDIWTRVMGYYRPAVLWDRSGKKSIKGSSYNRGKQGEFIERVFFNTQK